MVLAGGVPPGDDRRRGRLARRRRRLLVLSYYLVLTGWVRGFLVSWLAGAGASFGAFTVGTFALPISALCIVLVFVWGADLDAVRGELGRLDPLVGYPIPAVLAVITVAIKHRGGARSPTG